MKIKNKYKLLLVEWEDSALGFQGWKIIKKQKHKTIKFTSVGFLTHEDKASITLYPHIDKQRKTGTGDITIPKSAIRTISYLVKEEGK